MLNHCRLDHTQMLCALLLDLVTGQPISHCRDQLAPCSEYVPNNHRDQASHYTASSAVFSSLAIYCTMLIFMYIHDPALISDMSLIRGMPVSSPFVHCCSQSCQRRYDVQSSSRYYSCSQKRLMYIFCVAANPA